MSFATQELIKRIEFRELNECIYFFRVKQYVRALSVHNSFQLWNWKGKRVYLKRSNQGEYFESGIKVMSFDISLG